MTASKSSEQNAKPHQGKAEPEHQDQGLVRTGRGEIQPQDKSRAQHVTNSEAAGLKSQKEAARQQVPSPGEPAGGE